MAVCAFASYAGAQEELESFNIEIPAIKPVVEVSEPLVPETKAAKRYTKMRGMAGGITSLATDVDTKVEPWVWIDVDVPTADNKKAPSLLVQAALSALPGETINAQDPATYRSLEFKIGLAQPIAPSLHFDLYAEGGFATRLPGDSKPRESTARWIAGGLRFKSPRGHLALGIGADQRLTGVYRPAVTIAGAVKMYELKNDKTGKPKGPQMSLVGDAILGLDAPAYGSYKARDVVRIGIAIGN